MNKMLMIGLVALVFSSCQSGSEKKKDVIIPTPNGVPSASSEKTPPGQKPANNPAHGQPFHDCALPVGAALVAKDSPTQPSAVTAPVDLKPEVQEPAASTTKEVKLNPAHGAPGHKCEVAVGSPLS